MSPSRKHARPVRYAVVGLGHFAQAAILPAFAHASNAELAALVSDDEEKRGLLSRRYDVPSTYTYEAFDDCLCSGDVDAVYIALPNAHHREFTVCAAARGVHVLCEKPMAVTSDECRAMIVAADQGHTKLMVAYRLHFEEANLRAVELARSGALGVLKCFDSVFTLQVREGNIRLDEDLSGGPLYDIGVYCINAARYLFQDEPEAVVGVALAGRDPRFREVPETVSALMRFPGERVAQFTCSFGAADVSMYRLVGTEGWLRAEPAYDYTESLRLEVTRGQRTTSRRFPKRDQVAAEIVYFSSCILEDTMPEPSGQEGLTDVMIIEAIQRSAARDGGSEALDLPKRTRRPGMEQHLKLPPVRKPRLVKVASSHQ